MIDSILKEIDEMESIMRSKRRQAKAKAAAQKNHTRLCNNLQMAMRLAMRGA